MGVGKRQVVGRLVWGVMVQIGDGESLRQAARRETELAEFVNHRMGSET